MLSRECVYKDMIQHDRAVRKGPRREHLDQIRNTTQLREEDVTGRENSKGESSEDRTGLARWTVDRTPLGPKELGGEGSFSSQAMAGLFSFVLVVM